MKSKCYAQNGPLEDGLEDSGKKVNVITDPKIQLAIGRNLHVPTRVRSVAFCQCSFNVNREFEIVS